MDLCVDEEELSSEEGKGVEDEVIDRNAAKLVRPVAAGAPDHADSENHASEVQCVSLP